MNDYFARMGAKFRNEMRQSNAVLIGIVQGILADGILADSEIQFLRDWLTQAEVISKTWTGSAIYQQVQDILRDNIITAEERTHLIHTLQLLAGGDLDDLDGSAHINRLALEDLSEITIAGNSFCFTGEFVFGPRPACEQRIIAGGGSVSKTINRHLNYLVVGGLGSTEWKDGNFGTKIEKAVEYRASGVPLHIIHEDVWANSL